MVILLLTQLMERGIISLMVWRMGGFAFVVGLMIGVLIQTILIGIQSKLFVGISGAAIAELTMVLAPVVIMLTILVGLILINDDKNHTGLICLGAGISAGVGTTAVLDSLFLSKVLYSGALGGAIGTGSGLLGIGSCF
ncbi:MULTISPECIES: hypothetical protein [Moraxella]|nr:MULTISPECIES: hypothetical protein [Moraxella]MBE9589167.1 hypothetical protein [Moraxella sp. K1630]MBE9591641.1 hypothetical protein [Moraxella sp. K127]MBE9597414.1 hypothetical protein [Moraxella sp. K2450]MDH9220078.1 hypothetical protein [Moraxella lacunata]MDI4482223.1 hypothetical protein [Moraxella lacunata]